MAHTRRSSVPNANSPLSRTSPLPPLTSLPPSIPSPAIQGPPPPYTAPLSPPFRSLSVPHLSQLSFTSRSPSSDQILIHPEPQSYSPTTLTDLHRAASHNESAPRRPPRPQRSRTSSSTSLGLTFGATRAQPPSFEESSASHGATLPYDSEDEALEMRTTARLARRRQASEGSTVHQRRVPNVDSRPTRPRSARASFSEETSPLPVSSERISFRLPKIDRVIRYFNSLQYLYQLLPRRIDRGSGRLSSSCSTSFPSSPLSLVSSIRHIAFIQLLIYSTRHQPGKTLVIQSALPTREARGWIGSSQECGHSPAPTSPIL